MSVNDIIQVIGIGLAVVAAGLYIAAIKAVFDCRDYLKKISDRQERVERVSANRQWSEQVEKAQSL